MSLGLRGVWLSAASPSHPAQLPLGWLLVQQLLRACPWMESPGEWEKELSCTWHWLCCGGGAAREAGASRLVPRPSRLGRQRVCGPGLWGAVPEPCPFLPYGFLLVPEFSSPALGGQIDTQSEGRYLGSSGSFADRDAFSTSLNSGSKGHALKVFVPLRPVT